MFYKLKSNPKLGQNLSAEKGQALIILLMIMLVALTVGLAITQRSISDLAQSNREEQSTRAYSAAESGIEQALQNPSISGAPISLGNQSTTTVRISPALPHTGKALEYPPIGRDTVAQFWLADPNTLTSVYPSNQKIDIYFGLATPNPDGSCCSNNATANPDTPAIEINIIYLNSGDYSSTRYFFDPLSTTRRLNNNFYDPSDTTTWPGSDCPSNGFPSSSDVPINTSNSQNTTIKDRYFRCKVALTTPSSPVMIRARVLYSNTAQPIAVGPDDSCTPSPCSLPQQATIYTSIGSAGQVQRKLQVFKLQNVVPQLFDFAIFSASNITKN